MGANDSRFGTGDVADVRRYIKLGALGQTFAAAERHVLLNYPARWEDLGPRYNQ